MKARLPQGFGGGPSNMNGMLKQAQKMQEEMSRVSEELEAKEYSATGRAAAPLPLPSPAAWRSNPWT